MKYLQKAYSLIKNGVHHKDHLMKAHLDYATKEALSEGIEKYEFGNNNQTPYKPQFNKINESNDQWESDFEFPAGKRSEWSNKSSILGNLNQDQLFASRNSTNQDIPIINSFKFNRTNEDQVKTGLVESSKPFYEEGNVLLAAMETRTPQYNWRRKT